MSFSLIPTLKMAPILLTRSGVGYSGVFGGSRFPTFNSDRSFLRASANPIRQHPADGHAL
jgi:hypothetical protein